MWNNKVSAYCKNQSKLKSPMTSHIYYIDVELKKKEKHVLIKQRVLKGYKINNIFHRAGLELDVVGVTGSNLAN